VINQSAYVPVQMKDGDKEQMYNQPQLARDLLTRVAYSNPKVLEKLKPVHNHGKLIPPRKQVKTLKDLAMIGAEDVNIASQVWSAFWREMQEPSRPAILIAIDGINFWMGPTKYRSADYKIIHSHQLTLITQFLDLIFSKTEKALPNGGIVLASTTKSNHPTTPSFDFLVRQIQARRQGIAITDPAFPLHEPYMKQADQRVGDLVQNIEYTQLTELKGLSRGESKGLLEYFARSGILREQVTDGHVAEKWSLSGGGIVGELCKLGSRSRMGMFETGRREGVRIRV
jgi:small subunit ribosomal protein S29